MRFGRHTVLFELARGGMAEVFVTLADGTHTPCVLKRPLGGAAASAALGRRFRREGDIVSRLDHPNIARVVEIGTGEPPFIAFEYVAGQTVEHILDTLHARGERMPVDLALSITVAILDALDHAHGLRDEQGVHLGLVHRDLTPRNVMLGYDGVVKLIDFGVARASVDDFRTEPGMLIGTIQYFSPEQSAGEPVDARSDLYSLSAVAFELLTGRPLVAGGSPLEMLTAIYAGVVPNLGELTPEAPRWLDAVLRRGLARDRADRWASAAELRAELLAQWTRRPAEPTRALARLMDRLYPERAREEAELVARALAERGLGPGTEDDAATLVRTPREPLDQTRLVGGPAAPADAPRAVGATTPSFEPPRTVGATTPSFEPPRVVTPALVVALGVIVVVVGAATAWLAARPSEPVIVVSPTLDAPAARARTEPELVPRTEPELTPRTEPALAAQAEPGARDAPEVAAHAEPHPAGRPAAHDDDGASGSREGAARGREEGAAKVERGRSTATPPSGASGAASGRERERRVARLEATLAALRDAPDDVDLLQELARQMRAAAAGLDAGERKKLDAAIDAAVRSGDVEALARGLARLTRALGEAP